MIICRTFKIVLSFGFFLVPMACVPKQTGEPERKLEIEHALDAVARHLGRESVAENFVLRIVAKDGLGEEGYRVKTVDDRPGILVEGSNSHAIANGIYRMVKKRRNNE